MSDFFCELSSRIVPGDARCMQYRASRSLSCRDCELIKPAVEAVTVEVESMPVAVDKPKQLRKGDKFHCPECGRDNATYESGGLCGVCNAKRRKLKCAVQAAKSGPVVKPAVVYPDLQEAASDLPYIYGQLQSTAGGAVRYEAIRCLLDGVERRLLVAVSGMSDDEAIIYAALHVQQLEV